MSVITLEDVLGYREFYTDTWSILRILDTHPSNIRIDTDGIRPYPEPKLATEFREHDFVSNCLKRAKQYAETKAKLEKSGKEFYIGRYDSPVAGAIPFALFEKGSDKRLNFEGSNYNLAGLMQKDNKLVLQLYEIAYSEWMACQNPEFTEAYENQHGWIPHAGIGISTVVETADNFFVLTNRGMITPNYPGTYFTIGGRLVQSVADDLVYQIMQESKLAQGKDYDPKKMTAMVLGADKQYHGGKHIRHELVAYAKIKRNFNTVIKRQKKTDFQPDVDGLLPLPTDYDNFSDFILKEGPTGKLISAGELGLIFGYMQKQINDGKGQIIDQMDRLMYMRNQYISETYSPAKLKLMAA